MTNGYEYPDHSRRFTGAEAAAPPADTPVAGIVLPQRYFEQQPERLPDPQYRPRHFYDVVGAAPGAGAVVHNREELGFEAKTGIFCNTSTSTFTIPGTDLRIPAGVVNLVVAFRPYIDHYTAVVFASGATAGELSVILTEERFNPTLWETSAVVVEVPPITIAHPLGEQLAAASVSVAIASDQTPVLGAANKLSSVVTIAAGVGAIAARATRTGIAIRARKLNAADIVDAGGAHLQPGDALSLATTAAFAFTGTNGDILDVWETYN